ncbi:MAG: enolase C-terminal domain-like protein [Gammaproteobacteria bacterium]
MKIRSIEASAFRLPSRRTFKWAGLNGELGSFVLVRVTTDDGLVGYGEATALPDWGGDFGRRSGETPATVISLVNTLFAPALVGTDPTQVTAARKAMDRLAVGNNYAKCAVDIALHDLWGKSVGLPIYRLLGGAVRDCVAIAHMIGLMDEAHAAEEGIAAVADGVRALQIKGGVNAERDIRLVRTLRRELGSGVTLRLDANQGYGHAKSASRIVARLADAGVDLVEQPTTGYAFMAEVTAGATVPIIADESCWDVNDALEVVRNRAADCISIYLAKAGGFVGARAVAAVAEAQLIACDLNGSIESAIGNAANTHFALAHSSVTLASVIPISAPSGAHPYAVAGRYYEDDVISEPFPVRDGAILPLDRPGLGIVIDEARLARYRCDG